MTRAKTAVMPNDSFKYSRSLPVPEVTTMGTISLEQVHQDILHLQKDIAEIKSMIAKDYELSDQAKKELDDARKTPLADYISQEEMEREFLQQ